MIDFPELPVFTTLATSWCILSVFVMLNQLAVNQSEYSLHIQS